MSNSVEVDSQTQLILVNPSAETVEVINSGPQALALDPVEHPIQIINSGPQGPPGIPGSEGPQGPPGDGVLAQSMTVESPGPVSIWQINHPYDHDPSVEIRDTANTVCQAPISFTTGKVIINISPLNMSLRAKLTP
jgi:hypothetical protein